MDKKTDNSDRHSGCQLPTIHVEPGALDHAPFLELLDCLSRWGIPVEFCDDTLIIRNPEDSNDA